jgi:hypothetical protein
MSEKYITLKDLQKKRPLNMRKVRKAARAIIRKSRRFERKLSKRQAKLHNS